MRSATPPRRKTTAQNNEKLQNECRNQISLRIQLDSHGIGRFQDNCVGCDGNPIQWCRQNAKPRDGRARSGAPMALVRIEVSGQVGRAPWVEPNLAGDVGLYNEPSQLGATIGTSNLQ